MKFKFGAIFGISKILRSFIRRNDSHLDANQRATCSAAGMPAACFDADWYRQKYRLELDSACALWKHYLRHGAGLGCDPCEFFWTDWYLQQYKDVARADMNPLLHYEMAGAKEGRLPSPLFDPAWYSMAYGIDIDQRNPLAHFLHVGRRKGHAPRADAAIISFHRRDASPAFDTLHIEEIAWKAAHVGQDAFFEGELTDGRSYLADRGSPPVEHPVLEKTAEDMTENGSASCPPYMATFSNVIIIPGSTSLIDGRSVVNDEIAAAVRSGTLGRELKLWDRTWYKSGSLLIRYKIAPSLPLRSGIHLSKEHEANYFHFLSELMPKLYFLEKIGTPVDIPLLVTDDMDSQMYEAIAALKSEGREVIKLARGVPYKVENLLYLSDMSLITDMYEGKPQAKHTFLPQGLLQEMSKFLLRGRSSSKPKRNIYIPRRNTRRVILNESEIIDALISKGFEVVDPHDLSFSAQIDLFSSAAMVVGGTGAAFTNLLWCSPGTKAVILYPDHPYNNTTFWDTIGRTKEIQIRYLEGRRAEHVHGRYSMHDDFTINLDALLRAIA